MIEKLSEKLRELRLVMTGMFPVVTLAAAWVLAPPPRLLSLLLGSLLVAAGMGLRLWAAGHLVKLKTLTTGGPFAYTRNPLYAGSTLAAAGFCVASQWVWSAALLVVVYLLCYLPTVLHEERLLRTVYGEQYDRYREAVPRFLVRLRPYSERGERGFDWRQMVRNRELQAMVSTLVPLLLMWLRLKIPGGLGALP